MLILAAEVSSRGQPTGSGILAGRLAEEETNPCHVTPACQETLRTVSGWDGFFETNYETENLYETILKCLHQPGFIDYFTENFSVILEDRNRYVAAV